MITKKFRRTIRYFFARLFLRISVVIIYFIPFSLFCRLSVFLSKIFYKISNYYRGLAYNNLKVVFPEERKRREILYKSSIHQGKNIAYTFWILAHPHKRKKMINVENKEILDYALSFNKGVIGVTAHIGAFTVLGGVLSNFGYKVNYILRTPRDEKMTSVLGRGLRMQRVYPIFTKPATRCIEKSIEALRRNEILIVLIDQEAGKSGVYVRLFNRYTSAPAGPIIFSLRTEAKIIPMFMLEKNHQHNLVILPEFKLIYKENREKTIFENTQRLIYLVEEIIRKYPDQWSWIDRRWRF